MEPLDLTTRRPRKARDEVAGIVFLPRSIDKARASLPGGTLGEYTRPGFTATMLKHFGITVDAFIAAVGGGLAPRSVIYRGINGFGIHPVCSGEHLWAAVHRIDRA